MFEGDDSATTKVRSPAGETRRRRGMAPMGASLFGGGVPTPAAVPVSAAVPSFSVQSQQISQSQVSRFFGLV